MSHWLTDKPNLQKGDPHGPPFFAHAVCQDCADALKQNVVMVVKQAAVPVV